MTHISPQTLHRISCIRHKVKTMTYLLTMLLVQEGTYYNNHTTLTDHSLLKFPLACNTLHHEMSVQRLIYSQIHGDLIISLYIFQTHLLPGGDNNTLPLKTQMMSDTDYLHQGVIIALLDTVQTTQTDNNHQQPREM